MYRYKDVSGQACWVYAQTLNELREKEKGIQKDMFDGIRTRPKKMSVSQLIEKFQSMDGNLRPTTANTRRFMWNTLYKDPFVSMKVEDVHPSTAKALLLRLKNDKGYTAGTMSMFYGLLKRTFEVAVQDDYIRKNPFNFRLNSIMKM